MRILFAAALWLLLIAPLHARADWAYTKWGMSPEQVVAASGGAVRLVPPGQRREGAGRELGAEGEAEDSGIRLHVGFGFDTKTHGLSCVFYNVADKAQNAALKDLLTRRYGRPSGNDIAGLAMWHWSKPDSIDLQSMTDVAASVQQCRPGTM